MVRDLNTRFITVICSHPKKPQLRAYRFPRKLKMVRRYVPEEPGNFWAEAPDEWWRIAWGDYRIDDNKVDYPERNRSGTGLPEPRYRWQCPEPACAMDLPLRHRTLVRLIAALDQIEQAQTGHRHAVRLDIARVQLVLRSLR